MKKLVMVVHDALNGFMDPFLAPTEAFAKRDMASAVNNDRSQSAISYSPNDFTLYRLGTFDTDKAVYDLEPAPVLICRGGSLIVEKG